MNNELKNAYRYYWELGFHIGVLVGLAAASALVLVIWMVVGWVI